MSIELVEKASKIWKKYNKGAVYSCAQKDRSVLFFILMELLNYQWFLWIKVGTRKGVRINLTVVDPGRAIVEERLVVTTDLAFTSALLPMEGILLKKEVRACSTADEVEKVCGSFLYEARRKLEFVAATKGDLLHTFLKCEIDTTNNSVMTIPGGATGLIQQRHR